jgi:putative transposase
LEQRRLRAVALSHQGFGPTAIARELGTTPQSVCQWLRQHRRRGNEGLRARKATGRPPKLNAGQRQTLRRLLLKGACAAGFATDLWTCPRIAEVVRQRFGARYHVDAVPRLMAGLGFSPSKAQAPRAGTR